MGLFDLTNFNESSETDVIKSKTLKEFKEESVFTEAVFEKGKTNVEPLLESITKVKEEFDKIIKEKGDEFDPTSFWKNPVWKDFEDSIIKVFGFRLASVNPFLERYNKKKDEFQSKMMNCMVYNQNRFMIEGLLSEKGFYDSTHSVRIDIYITLGLLKALTPEEILAVFLHEFGHGIDPALVSIEYHKTNALTEDLTDREKKDHVVDKRKKKIALDKILLEIAVLPFGALIAVPIFAVKGIAEGIKALFKKTKVADIRREKFIKFIEKNLKAQTGEDKIFNKHYYSEAYADNFARMYGYGPQLISALKKLDKELESKINSLYFREKDREAVIRNITVDALFDCHKTSVHRAMELIKEYKDDLNDPNIPNEVKKHIKEDMEATQKILDSYTKDFSKFQNQVNELLIKEIKALEKEAPEDVKKEKEEIEKMSSEKNKEEKPIKESTNNPFLESKKAHEKLMHDIKIITPEERSIYKRLFGDVGCSLAKERDGYYVTTHRARSKSYEKIEDIPKKTVKFIDSTC